MLSMRPILCITLAVGRAGVAAAADDVPKMFSVGHETEDSTLSVQCERTAPRKAVCSIIQVVVRQPNVDPAERAEEFAEFDKLVRSKRATPSSRRAV